MPTPSDRCCRIIRSYGLPNYRNLPYSSWLARACAHEAENDTSLHMQVYLGIRTPCGWVIRDITHPNYLCVQDGASRIRAILKVCNRSYSTVRRREKKKKKRKSNRKQARDPFNPLPSSVTQNRLSNTLVWVIVTFLPQSGARVE